MSTSIEDKFFYFFLAGMMVLCLIASFLVYQQIESEQVDVDLVNEMYHDRDIGGVKRNSDENFKWDLRVEFVDGEIAFFNVVCEDNKKSIESCNLKKLK